MHAVETRNWEKLTSSFAFHQTMAVSCLMNVGLSCCHLSSLNVISDVNSGVACVGLRLLQSHTISSGSLHSFSAKFVRCRLINYHVYSLIGDRRAAESRRCVHVQPVVTHTLRIFWVRSRQVTTPKFVHVCRCHLSVVSHGIMPQNKVNSVVQ